MSDYSPSLRRSVVHLFIVVAVAAVCGRILSANRVYEPYLFRDEANPEDTKDLWPRSRPEPIPSFGSNDRSRWDTVRALVDEGTYVIGHQDVDPDTGEHVERGIVTEDGWGGIDRVRRPDTHDFYSSKPPLLPTLVAGEYWLLKHLCGWSIVTDRWQVMRTILLTINALPLLVYLLLLARLLERFGTTDWGRLYVLAAACGATFLTTFAITFNNHTVATCSALFALYPALQIWYDGKRDLGLFLLAGLFAGFTACNELPAAAFLVALFLLLLLRAPARTLLAFAPAAALPVAALLLTNHLAIGEWLPAYEKFGTEWYNYPGSYWKAASGEVRHGIDWAHRYESQGMYAFNLLLGHHGLFSLSPVFLLAVAGISMVLLRRTGRGEGQPAVLGTPYSVPGTPASTPPRTDDAIASPPALRMLAGLTLFLAVVVIGFYIFGVDYRNRNYGGWTSGPRWLMWLTPFWLLTMLPAADWLAGRRWGRGLGYLLLGVSVLSVSYPAWNPWRHPWIYNFLESQGWIQY